MPKVSKGSQELNSLEIFIDLKTQRLQHYNVSRSERLKLPSGYALDKSGNSDTVTLFLPENMLSFLR
jgi:hypothetical protein